VATDNQKRRFGPIKLVYPCHFLLKCLYQARKMSSHVYVHCHLVATNNLKRRFFGPMKLVYPRYFLLKCLYQAVIYSLCLNFFHLLSRKSNLEKKIIFIQTNSFIIFTCPNPVLLVPGFEQVGYCEDCMYMCVSAKTACICVLVRRLQVYVC